MATYLLEFDHDIRHVFIPDLLPSPLMGDRPVLAEDTAEVAVGEEDGAGAIFANQRCLFAKMRMVAENDGLTGARQNPLSPFCRFTPHRLGQSWQCPKIL